MKLIFAFLALYIANGVSGQGPRRNNQQRVDPLALFKQQITGKDRCTKGDILDTFLDGDFTRLKDEYSVDLPAPPPGVKPLPNLKKAVASLDRCVKGDVLVAFLDRDIEKLKELGVNNGPVADAKSKPPPPPESFLGKFHAQVKDKDQCAKGDILDAFLDHDLDRLKDLGVELPRPPLPPGFPQNYRPPPPPADSFLGKFKAQVKEMDQCKKGNVLDAFILHDLDGLKKLGVELPAPPRPPPGSHRRPGGHSG